MSKALRILIVEDSTADAELMELELCRAGLSVQVQQVYKKETLLKAIKTFNPDLVLSDHSVPNLNSLETLKLLREHNSQAPFIIVSGTIGEENVADLLKHGAADFVSKQHLSNLAPTVRRALQEVAERSERQKSESRLRDSESRFRAVFERASTGIVVEDLHGKIIETNRALQQMLGYTAEELQQITRKDFTHSADNQEETRHFNRLVSGETEYYQFEKRFVRKDGRIIAGRLTVSMVRDSSGKPQFPIVMIEDVTERQRAEEALLQYAAIVESSNDAIVSTTFDGIIFSWNPAAERLYGYTAAEANGRSMTMILLPEKEEEFFGILEKLRRGERMENFETMRLRKDGSIIHISSTTSPIKDVSGKVIGASSISRNITERKRAEEALRKSQASLARAQQIAHLGNWERDAETNQVAWSDETYRIFGLQPQRDEISLEMFFQRVHPEDRELVQRDSLENLERGIPYSLDYRILLPNGEVKTVNEQGEVIVDETGKPVRFVGTVLDITKRKRAEIRSTAFSNLGQRLSSATTAREAAQIIVDVADKLLGWHSCAIDLCSTDQKTVNSILAMDLIDGQCVDVPLIYLNNATPSRHTRSVLERGAKLILRKPPFASSPDFNTFGDKSRPSASLMFAPIRNRARVIGVLTIQSYSPNAYTEDDLNTLQALADHCGGALERIRAEAENQKLAAFPQFNPNPVLEFTADGRLNYFNGAALQMAKSLDKSDPSEFLPPEAVDIVKRCLATGQSSMRHERVIENRTISSSFFPIAAIGVVHCYAADITDRQNLEAQLRQSQKMESVGQLAGGIAHDFNNILTVIQGHGSLLTLSPNLPEEAIESAQQIALAAERAANLTRQLLTFSRRQIIQPKELDLNEVVSNMTKMLRRLLGEDITLQVKYGSSLPFVHADPGMMEQILLNLSVNARDAMPKGGRLFITTCTVNVDDNLARQHPGAKQGVYVGLIVKDTGTGIPPEILPRIFDPFFTTKDVGKGTGLGLATVYGIVQQHKGWTNVSSKVNKETIFEIFLPATAAKVAVADNAKESEAKVGGGTETILVVEDEAPLRVLVRSVLQRYGYNVLEAESGVNALPIWLEHKDQISLLLTDMVMPHGVSGRELAQRLQGDKPSLKVIYSSGYSLAVVGTDMVLREGLNFLQKPYHPRKLAQAVRDCLDQ
ncbi:MAG: multi-sensor hybrid histidine kinase [Pedosphaera sp.]|nr:multi-sensor hybrid histidine kinase [Pedosphaera sp.]